jgi:quaternary ammonium compound-resistance protein SugE
MDNKSMVMALGAAMMFAAGGLCMKPSLGFTVLGWSLLMVGLFGGGAILNALVVHRGGELGVAYLLVVGCETLLAFALGAVVYHERVTPVRVLAMLLVAGGALLLAGTEHKSSASPADVVLPVLGVADR